MFSFEIDYLGNVAQQDRRVVAIRNDKVPVVCRERRLVVGDNFETLSSLIDITLGAVGVGGGHGRSHVLHADAVAVEPVGFELIRTDGNAPPLSVIWPTPLICDSCC